jgi:site-specific DNA-methyltransferase (adenine-specific)
VDFRADSVDLIVTDPPYRRECLGVYETLGAAATRVLKSGGLAVVMARQTYLREVIAALDKHLSYHWPVAYLTPGGQAVQFDWKVNTFSKPVLIYRKGTYEGNWFGDVARSKPNDNDRRHHD